MRSAPIPARERLSALLWNETGYALALGRLMENAHVPQPVYRSARLVDLHDIADIEAAVFPEPYLYLMLRQLFELHGSEWLVAELDGAVIGYALTLERRGRSVLFTFAV